MDHDTAKLIFDVLQTILIAAVGVTNWLNNRQRVTTASITNLKNSIDGRLDTHTERITRVEQDLKNGPNHTDFGEANRRLTALNGEMKELKGELRGVHTTLNLIHQYLLGRNL